MKKCKKLVTFLLLLCLLLGCMPLNGLAATKVPGGYTAIATPQDLNKIRNNLNGRYILTTDIDLTAALSKGGVLYDAKGWVSIGSNSEPFTGVLDGNGHTIKGYKSTQGLGKSSLIHTNTGTIKNLTIAGTSGAASAFCGVNKGTVQNCHNQVTYSDTIYTSSEVSVGGLVGTNAVGGIVEYCSNTVALKGTVRSNGGNSDKTLRIGGIVGTNNGTVRKCWNTGEITNYGGNGTSAAAAGIVGYGGNDSLIENCYNAGKIYVDMESTGYNWPANVSSAGIMASMYYQHENTIRNCYNVGKVSRSSGYHNYYLGAIAGFCGSQGGRTTFEKCYWLEGSCTQSNYHGGDGTTSADLKRLTSNQMTTQSSFTGFDFSKVWSMGTGSYRYPVLKVGCTHSVDTISAVVATCTEDGNIRYYYCNICNKYFKNSTKTTEITKADTVIKAGHSWTVAEELAERLVPGSGADCQTFKEYYFGCANCTAVSTTEKFTGTTKGSHVMSTGWTTENGKHYRACTVTGCNYKEDEELCSGGTATCTEKAVCSTCNKPYGDELSHSWTVKEELDARLVPGSGADCQTFKEYYFGCANCTAVSTTEKFTGTTKGSHVVSTGWTTENGKHYRACTVTGCDYKEDEELCSGGTATCTEKAICATCSQPYDSDPTHNWTVKEELTERQVPGSGADCQSFKEYYFGCANCTAVSTTEKFTGTTKGSHVMSTGWTTENGKHYHACTVTGCDYKEDEELCSGGTATCTEKAVCATCTKPYGDDPAHSWTVKEELDARQVPGSGADCQSFKEYYYGCANCTAVSTTEKFTGTTKGSHVMSTGWTTENGKHYHACTVTGCDHKENEESCSGGTATCTEKAVCATCTKPYGDDPAHSWTVKEELDARLVPGSGADCQSFKEYYYGCANCAAVSTTEKFTGSTKGSHVMSTGWTTENGKHYRACTVTGCDHKENEEACGGGTATCTEKAVCATCTKPYGDDPAHSWTDATCTLPKTCSACGTEDGAARGHDMSDWNRDEQSHWKTCNRNCGLTTDLGVHRDDDSNGSCDACAKAMSAATPTDPAVPTVPSEPATAVGTGDVSMLPWILLLCVSAAGMLLAWKRLRKASVSK